MPTLHLDADALARHRLRLGRETRSLRPVRLRLDDEGLRLSLDLPGVDWLAALVTLDGPAYRDGSTLLLGEEPLDVSALADGLRERLRDLPDRPDAEEAYRDLRLAAGTSSATFGAYLLDVVRAYVRTLPKRPAVSTPKASRPAPMTALERKHAERARRREEERASAEWALALYLDDEAPEPGSRVSGSVVFEYVEEALAYAVERFEETVLDPDPSDEDLYRRDRAGRLAAWDEIRADEWESPPPARPRPVSRRVLFEVAAEVGAFRVTRPKGSVALTIVRRFIRRLKEATVTALRHAAEVLGDRRSPEAYASDVEARIGRPKAPARADERLASVADALPFPVAAAMASSDDPRRALGLVGRDWLRRHPEDREAVSAAAGAFGEDLVEAVRYRVASALAEEGSV